MFALNVFVVRCASRTLNEMVSLPKKFAFVGSGFIAVEFAGIFQALGAEVHLIYRQPLPLRGFDQDLREGLAEALASQGVPLHPSCNPERV